MLIHLSRAVVARIVLVLILALVAAVVVTTPRVGAQTTADLDPTQTSVAVPFIGEFEVWCTDRNPSPNNICANHHGSPAIDFGMPVGAQLRATGNGVVIDADSFCSGPGSCNSRAGNKVVIEHPDGNFSRYLHMDEVFVSVGDTVSTGDLLGTNGVTGHNSSPHLHFDEQFPLGNRIEFGSFVGCVDGQRVEYPAALGFDDWNDVPFGSIVVNEDYSCHGQTGLQSPPNTLPTAAPRVFPGPTIFAVAPPVGSTDSLYEINLTVGGAGSPQTFRLTGGALARFDTAAGVTEIRAREIIDGVAQQWSEITTYDPATEPARASCDGLYASQASLNGTAQADVIIGTEGSDVINAGNGNDVICSLGGNDTISAGRGSDRVFAGSGDDDVLAGRGGDLIYGGLGNDTLHGMKGSDEVRGGGGSDTVIGGNGPDQLYGGSGRDNLEGRGGNDLLHGKAGNDTYDGGAGDDSCIHDSDHNEGSRNCER